ncbi:MAG TPA: hypothetical protein VJ440_05420, partial [Candidatus Brocadiaceae bacterium]|nr:hypothetical protein [Candidatus Brocadiaceae bacterium]
KTQPEKTVKPRRKIMINPNFCLSTVTCCQKMFSGSPFDIQTISGMHLPGASSFTRGIANSLLENGARGLNSRSFLHTG